MSADRLPTLGPAIGRHATRQSPFLPASRERVALRFRAPRFPRRMAVVSPWPLGAFAVTASPAVGTAARLHGAHDHRARPSDRRSLRTRRPRLRGREERSGQGLRQPDRHDADAVRTSTTSGTARLRARARPRLPGASVRLSGVHLRRADGSTALGVAGATTDGCAAAGCDDRRQQPDLAPAGLAVQHAGRDPRSCWCTTGASSFRATRSATSCSGPTERSTRAAAEAAAFIDWDNSGAEPAARRRATRAAN